jgi:hypothetical protein
MSRTQFGFTVGFALAVVWAWAGFLVALAVGIAGAAGVVIARLAEGRVDLDAWTERISAGRR